MRSLLLVSLLLCSFALWADPAALCQGCRDPQLYPQDYGNFVFNEVFGDTPTVSIVEANQILVTNPQGQWAVVDLNFEAMEIGFSLNLLIVGTEFTMLTGRIQIEVQDPYGTMTVYYVFANSPELVVGDGTIESDPVAEPDDADSGSADTTSTTSAGGEYTSYTYWGVDGTWYWYYEQTEFANALE
jgi:hypothetical protein